MSSQNTVSYASRAHSWLRKQPSLPLCVIIFVHRVRCVFVGCVRVISPTRSRRALQAPEITNSRTAARPGWMTVCGYNTTGWHAANHDHVASSRRVQPVPPALQLPPLSPAEGPKLLGSSPPQEHHVLLFRLRTVQLVAAPFALQSMC